MYIYIVINDVLGNNNFGMFCMVISTMPFYFGTMEGYYAGELIMQEINGVDDGAWLYIAFCFISASYGCEAVWGKEVSLFGLTSMKPDRILAYSLCIFLVPTTI